MQRWVVSRRMVRVGSILITVPCTCMTWQPYSVTRACWLRPRLRKLVQDLAAAAGEVQAAAKSFTVRQAQQRSSKGRRISGNHGSGDKRRHQQWQELQLTSTSTPS